MSKELKFLSYWKKKGKNWFFNFCHEIKVLLYFSWPFLLRIKNNAIKTWRLGDDMWP